MYFCPVLNISAASATVLRDGDHVNVTFVCIASGYPNVRLQNWQGASGMNISTALYEVSTTIEKSEFVVFLNSSLVTEAESVCWESRGFKCVFSNEGSLSFTENQHIPCPPGKSVFTSCQCL